MTSGSNASRRRHRSERRSRPRHRRGPRRAAAIRVALVARSARVVGRGRAGDPRPWWRRRRPSPPTSATRRPSRRCGRSPRRTRFADHRGQCRRRVRADPVDQGQRSSGVGRHDDGRCRRAVPRHPGLRRRDGRSRMGADRQHHVGRVAPPARPDEQRLRHGQGGPQPVHPPPRRRARRHRRHGERAPPGRRQDRDVGRHPRSGDRRRSGRPRPTSNGSAGWTRPAAIRRTRRSTPCCALCDDAAADISGQFCWIDDPLQPPIASWDVVVDDRPWTGDDAPAS